MSALPDELKKLALRGKALSASGPQLQELRRVDGQLVQASLDEETGAQSVVNVGTVAAAANRSHAEAPAVEWADQEPEPDERLRLPTGQFTVRCSDMGNAEYFVQQHGSDLRYVSLWKRWLAWDGRRWLPLDEAPTGLAAQAAKSFAHEANEAMASARARLIDAGDSESLKEAAMLKLKAAEALYKFAAASQSASRMRAAIEIARALPGIAVSHTQLDANPWILNVANGALDLRTGTLAPHSQADLCTKIADVAYDAAAECPTWDAFLARVMAGNEGLISFLQRMVGYALSGAIREHVLAFAFGGGANGKSTFLQVIRQLLGDYAITAPRTLLFGAKGEHPTTLATLFGVRMAICPEVDEGQTFDEGLLKDITGGDAIAARRMREDFWTFTPSHKLFLAGNHKPRLRGTDEGVWRRIKMVPWVVTIPKEERDTCLSEKLAAELPGILAWAVRGCLAWQRDGLGEPREVTEATSAYREESDLLGRFLSECCVLEADARIPRRALRTAYEEWCEELGAQPVAFKKFAEGLKSRGVSDGRQRLGAKVVKAWAGVRIQSETEAAREL